MSSTLTPRARSLVLLLSFAAVYIGWGTTYLANHFLLLELPPFVIVTLRFFLAGSLALLWVFVSGQARIQRSDWGGAFIGGLMLITVGQGALLYANQYLPTGLLAMLYTTLPIWSVALEWLLGDRPPLWVLCGLTLASVGIVLLMSNGLGSAATAQQWFAGSLVVAATLMWAVGAWLLRSRPSFRSTWLGMSLQMLIGALMLALFAAWRGEWHDLHLSQLSVQGWWWLAYLVLPVSLGVYPAYFWLLREVRPSLVSTFAFVNPVIALLLGYLLLGESLGMAALVACLVTLAGVMLIIFGRR
jgi:drug/metabolite transporter (DMT)-like permease